MSNDPANIINGEKLTRWFGEGDTLTYALKDVSVQFQRGEFVLLMGPSGSGKSTLLAVLSGLLRPQEGVVTVLDQNLWDLSDQGREEFRLRHCGFIFQGYNLFPSLSVRQQLEMVLRWGHQASLLEARRQVMEMLELLGIADKAQSRPGVLSGGEKQRVAIGRALIKSPELCFADEPTSALDWEHGEQVVKLLRDAADQRGASVVVVSHDHRLEPFADRVLYLEDGELVTEAQSSTTHARSAS